ncbi:MAG: hypothetical protein IKW74_07675 [Thermoguttaceae bacterium]|nr:hypothetical protein [Thermoguttaceae bacterium]
MTRKALAFTLCLVSCSFLFSAGCYKPKAELPFSEYGKTTDKVPYVPDRPVNYPVPEGVDKTPCDVEATVLEDVKSMYEPAPGSVTENPETAENEK